MHNLLLTKFHISRYKQQILNIRPTLLYFPSLCIMQLTRDKINKALERHNAEDCVIDYYITPQKI